MVWANFLHIYQPPTQYPEVLHQVVVESYLELLAILERNPRAKVTLNINASLTEQLAAQGFEGVIRRFIALAERLQIEFTGSAAYHALLPKLPESEIRRQVVRNTEINRYYFGTLYDPKGFFPPEMAYTPSVGKVVEELGFNWLILSEYGIPQTLKDKASSYSWPIVNSRLKAVFRDKDISLALAFNAIFSTAEFEDAIMAKYGFDGGIVTAMDGETFGHHNKGQEKILEAIYKHTTRVETLTISQFIAGKTWHEPIELTESSWGMDDQDLAQHRPFPLWDYPENPVHKLQWEFVDLALSTVTGADQASETRILLDKALHSDQFWWASARPFWRIDMIERGATLLKKVVIASDTATGEQKDHAKQLYDAVMQAAIRFKGEQPYDIPKRT